MKAFEKVMQRVHNRQNKPVHTVVRYNYTMEGSREFMLGYVNREKTVSFEKIFDQCQDKIHAIFLFLSMLELSQQRFMKLLVGEGRNNFIIEWNDNREQELKDEGIDVNELDVLIPPSPEVEMDDEPINNDDAALLN
jgi:segregation and condensation protein A